MSLDIARECGANLGRTMRPWSGEGDYEMLDAVAFTYAELTAYTNRIRAQLLEAIKELHAYADSFWVAGVSLNEEPEGKRLLEKAAAAIRSSEEGERT